MKQKRTSRYLVMGFGFGGNHGDGIGADGTVFSSTWYLKPTQFQSMIDNGHYKPEELEGCILIDKIPALEKDMSLAYTAPMVSVTLADGEVSRGADIMRDPTSGMVVTAVAEHNPTVGLLAAKALTDDSFVGLDKVSVAAYVEWWRAHGAVIGQVKSGQVAWSQ